MGWRLDTLKPEGEGPCAKGTSWSKTDPVTLVYTLVYEAPGGRPSASLFRRIRLIYGEKREPTSGLEPLTSSHYE
jgi:hypothetical protein